jgi:hypothetical protein
VLIRIITRFGNYKVKKPVAGLRLESGPSLLAIANLLFITIATFIFNLANGFKANFLQLCRILLLIWIVCIRIRLWQNDWKPAHGIGYTGFALLI